MLMYQRTALHGWPLADRLEFYSMPEPNSGCQLWIGSTDDKYGTLRWQGRLEKAHRLSWQCHCGPIPEGLLVCHSCDVYICINILHLWLGTEADNTQDMYDKGRRQQPSGADHPMAKLTVQAVMLILEDMRPSDIIGADYGVSGSQIRNIRSGKAWSTLQ